MPIISSKVVKHYNKTLLKPLILQVFGKSEQSKNILDLPDFSKEEKDEKENRVTETIQVNEHVEESGVNEKTADAKHAENINNVDINEDSETIEVKEEIDKDFESLENKLKGKKPGAHENLNSNKQKGSVVDEKGSSEYSSNVKDDEKVADNKKEVVPMIEEKRHLEILEAERNKYKTLGYKEGYDKGLLDAKEKFLKAYEADKKDYLESLASSFSDAINEIKKIRDILLELDKNLPKIVLNFVRRIVGVERKVNDKVIISVVKSKIEKLKTLEDIKFYVNPADVEYLRYEFPGYNIEADANVTKGSFRVKTRVGEVVFYLDKMLDDLEELIYEELNTTQSD